MSSVADADDRTANRTLEQWGLQKKWVVDKEGSEYKVHLCNYSGM